MAFNLLQNLSRRAKGATDVLRFLPSATKETLQKTGRFVQKVAPGKELARGIGTSLAMPKAKKWEEDRKRREEELNDLLLRKMKEARGDKERTERLKKIGKQTKSTSILEEVLEEAPTQRQVVASAAELGLLFSIGYKPYLKGAGYVPKATAVAKKVAYLEKGRKALKGAGIVKKIGAKVVKPVLREAGIGAGFWGAMEARKKEATTQDIIKAAEKGALISGGITTGAIGLGLGIKAVAPKVSKIIGKGVLGLEKAAAGKKVAPLGKSQIDDTLAYIGERKTIKQRVSGKALEAVQMGRKMKMRLFDRFNPLLRAENRILEVKGGPLKESEKIYRDARLLRSVADAKAENLAVQYIDDINRYDDAVKSKAKAYMAQLDFLDRAKLGQAVPGNQSYDDLVGGLRKMVAEIGPDDMKKVAEVKNVTRKYHLNLLNERVDVGLISKELKDTLMKTHPNYIPHNVIMSMDERVVQGLSQSLNVPKSDIMRAVGSVKNIDDPFVATIQRTPIATRVIEKNKLLNNLVSAQEKYKMFPGMQQITTPTKVPSGFGKINLFVNGNKQTWQVPGDIAVAVKNLDAPLTPGWFKLATLPQKVLKKGATQYNLSFALPNKFRDKQTALLTADAFIDDMIQRGGIAPDDAIHLSKKGLKNLYKTSGGYGASIFREGESKIMSDLSKVGMSKNLQYGNPLKMVDAINDRIEISTRLEVFKKALQQGLTAKDAAMVSRNASIDFAKMGTWMRPANKVVPFLNARVQGFINLPKAFIAQPETFARMQLYSSVYPTMLVHQHNRRFESYKNISQYFKNRYWIVMTGETDAIDDYSGQPIKVPQFVTLPKGEGQQLVGNPIQYYLEKSDGLDYRKTSEMLADTLGSASPMEFQQFDQANWASTLISQFGPLATMVAGKGFGKHPYFGTPIVPEARKKAPKEMQFKKTTPEVTKKLANTIGIAPAELEFYISTFGGLPQDIQRGTDIIYNVVREGKLGGHSISETPFGSVTQLPIARRFLREAKPFYSPEMEERKKTKEEIETGLEGKRLETKDKAEEIWIEMNKRKTKEEKLNYLNSLGDEMTPEIKEKMMSFKKYRQAVEVLKVTDSVELRARYILQRIDEMKDQEVSKEDRVKFLDDLEKSKILSSKVKERILELKNQ